jgi:apolipoprotein N-acyltransferase
MSSAYLFEPGEERPGTARPLGGTDRYYEPYNAAMLVQADGTIEPYHKSKLVAFVEIMPFEELMGPLTEFSVDLGGTTGSLGSQKEREVMATRDGRVKAAPVICYESVFGEHVADHVRNGATLLVIMTNDGWWGTSPGYRQHLVYGRLRAIETRRDIARSANTGISCFIDQLGGIHQATEWWTPAAIRAQVLANDRLTFFVRHGDIIGRAAVWLSAVLFLVLAWIRIRRRA